MSIPVALRCALAMGAFVVARGGPGSRTRPKGDVFQTTGQAHMAHHRQRRE